MSSARVNNKDAADCINRLCKTGSQMQNICERNLLGRANSFVCLGGGVKGGGEGVGGKRGVG